MTDFRVARRYARALFDVAREVHAVTDVSRGLGNLAFALREVPDAQRVLVDPRVPVERKLEMARSVTTNALVLRFAGLLARRRRFHLLGLIHEEFQTLSDAAEGISRVRVRSAAELTAAQKALLEKGLAGLLGNRIVGTYEIAKELIGGVWIRMGGKVLDASLQRGIQDLRHTFAGSSN